LAGEISGELATHVIDLTIAELASEIGEGRIVPKTLERLFENCWHRRVPVDVDMLIHACWIVSQPRTFIAHAWFPRFR
jgi:hypothetical protein